MPYRLQARAAERTIASASRISHTRPCGDEVLQRVMVAHLGEEHRGV